MDFKKTKTYENLAKSFAGECMAGMRYQFTALLATQQGYISLANEIREIAKNETNHAKVFFDYILAHGNEDITFCGDFPFKGDTLENGLKFALEAEIKESSEVYPEFAKIAREEGFTDIANTFDMVAKVEKAHAKKFEILYKGITDKTLLTSENKKLYVCSQCGYSEERETAWNICPLCQANSGFVDLNLPND